MNVMLLRRFEAIESRIAELERASAEQAQIIAELRALVTTPPPAAKSTQPPRRKSP